jgi:uncharacterized membrane protein YoaK (UPF0700 family)
MSGETLALAVAIVGGGVALAVLGGWPVTAWILSLAAARSADPAGEREADRALRGGLWIGLLERLAIVGSILVSYPAAIGVVIAIKGLGRYPELREARGASASERFIIGTLASFCWAGAVGVGARWALLALR